MIWAELNPAMLFMLGALLVMMVMMRRTYRGSETAGGRMPRQATRNVSSAATRAADLPGDGNLWEVRMHELARELSGQLDSKIVIVQQLVRHAEQQTARLELAIRNSYHAADAPPLPPERKCRRVIARMHG